MRVLFIGGTGIISSACVALAVERGFEVVLLNRGTSTRPVPDGVQVIQGDIRDKAAVAELVQNERFDVVADFVAFTPEHVQTDLELFRGRTGQYIFISSASAYQTPPANFITTESTPLRNPFWQYSRNKIACEDLLTQVYRDEGFPMTIVRPSHTYDQRLVPFDGGYTVLHRMKTGKPVIVHGDGTSLWTLTHHRDFAKAFVGLLGNPHAIGEAIHITGDEVLTWNQIGQLLADALGVEPTWVHVPSDVIAGYDANWGAGLLGDKAHCMVFDNSKVKGLVPGFVATIPFRQGANEIVAWYESHPEAQQVNTYMDELMDRIIADYAPKPKDG